MNYITEINRFYDWLETNPLNDSSINLWHALMHINNKCGWKREFSVAISTLELKTRLSKSSILRARAVLVQSGRIDFESRSGQLSAVYVIIAFQGDAQNDTQPGTQSGAQPGAQPGAQSGAQTVPINKLKKNILNQTPFTGAVAPDERKRLAKKKEEVPEPYWTKLVDTFFDFVKQKFGEPPLFAGQDPKFFKSIIQKLKARAAQKNFEWTEEIAVSRLKVFLSYCYDEPWLKSNFILKNLDSQFEKIGRAQAGGKTTVKNPPPQNVELEYLQERFLEGQLDIKTISEKHYLQLEQQGLVSITDEIIHRRINSLTGSNIFSESSLCQEYQSGKQTTAVVADRINLMRLAVLAYFKKLKIAAA